MQEIVTKEASEVKTPTPENFRKIKPESNITVGESRSFFEGKFKEDRQYYTSLEERIDRTPVEDSPNGSWTGVRGESKYIPSPETEKGRAAIAKLAEYGQDGIHYKHGEPDFSKCSEGTVEIDHMSAKRYDNFAQADLKLSEQWNTEKREGRCNWTDADVEDYRKNNRLSWHECCDTKTMHLVSQDIHGASTSVFLHSGGVAECKARDRLLGGEFDG